MEGDAGDADLVGREAERFDVEARFVERDEILLEIAAEPQRVHIEIGYDDGLRTRQLAFPFEIGDEFGWQEVRAGDPIRFEFTDHFYQRLRVELIEKESAFLILPRLVELVVHPAEYLGHRVDEVDVRLAVEPPKERIGELQHVLVAHLGGEPFAFEGRFESLCGGRVAVADRGREDENSVKHTKAG